MGHMGSAFTLCFIKNTTQKSSIVGQCDGSVCTVACNPVGVTIEFVAWSPLTTKKESTPAERVISDPYTCSVVFAYPYILINIKNI